MILNSALPGEAFMNTDVITVVGLICAVLFIHAIVTSSRRLASLGVATLTSVVVCVLGLVSILVLVPKNASVAETNEVLDLIAGVTTLGVVVALVFGARLPPRRDQNTNHVSSHQSPQQPATESARGAFTGWGRLMLAVLLLLIAAWGLGRWSAMSPAPQDTSPQADGVSPPVATEDTPASAQMPIVDEGTKSTALSLNTPDGVPTIEPYTAMGETVERTIPEDTEPAIYREGWKQDLTPEQIDLYAQGLVRAGLDQLELCKPGYTCHATMLYESSQQSNSPYAIWLQMTFTTRTGHEEFYYYYDGKEMKSWQMADNEWQYRGVLEEMPEQAKLTLLKLMAGTHLKN